MGGEVGFNEKFTKLRMEYDYLKEESANLIELYNNLVTVVGPNLETQYMVVVGMLEYRVFELTVAMRRWQRRFTLRQAAINRGEKPDFVSIENELDREFEEFKRKIEDGRERSEKAADEWRRDKMSDHDMTEIRALYLNAVKRLHPDLNPALSDGAKELWGRILEAYKGNQWADLRFLVGLIEGVVEGGETFPNSPDGIAGLESGCERLRGVCRDVRLRTAEVKEKKPYSYQSFLLNPDEVKQRQDALREQIAEIEGRIAEYEQTWEEECYGG